MKKRTDYFLLLPSLCGVAVFFVVPLCAIVYYALTENAFSSRFVGLENFTAILSNEYFRRAMGNTLTFTAIAVPVGVLLSLTAALWILRYARRIPMVKAAFFLPVLLPSATIVVLWQAYLANVPPFPSLIAIYLWKYSGLYVMLFLTALAAVEQDPLDAAKIDGCGFFGQVRYVLLPAITPTTFFVLILSFVNSFRIFREAHLLWGAYPADEVYLLQHYLNNHFEKMNYQNIASAALIFGGIVYAVVGILLSLERRRDV